MKITPHLIEKYLRNQCTAEERSAVNDWYKNFSNEPDPFGDMSIQDQENIRQSIYERYKQSKAQKEDEGQARSYKSTLYWMLGATSSMAALILIIVKLIGNQPALPKVQHTASLQLVYYNNNSGIVKKNLPDHSVVWLSPKSTLTYPKNFVGHYREVKLQGEAFFEVTKDKAHPFIIKSNDITTKVWGTSFRVRAFKNSPEEVTVVTGKVSVHERNSAKSVMLLPNQKATLLNHAILVKKSGSSIKAEMRIWHKTSLSFNDARLNQVFTALSKNFDISIHSSDAKLNNLIFTGDFTDQNLPAILDMIQQSVNASYHINANGVFEFQSN
ncbi:FecR family protein [Mucilaginibacter terrae]|uniref:Transmembrane sensor n=1 Tax=Mucilaginibacter terrae TaxID=1955052 RepID=A0ABU3GU13_9SPHI|nr:FecR family protein [Mucilaginibacter terrae]MDT3403254.1 transmembrane sensor [Mucilaginibacter terrae]